MSDKEKVKIDQFADSVFKELGYDTEADDHLRETYVKYKRVKDFLQPGKLTAEGYAMVVMLAEVSRPEKSVLKSKKKPLKSEKKASTEESESDKKDESKADDIETPDNPFDESK